MNAAPMVPVARPYLPSRERFDAYLDRAWDDAWLTNGGQLVVEFERRLAEYLHIPSCIAVSNGTIALQIAIRALDLQGSILTTPFSYVATTSAAAWEGLRPTFGDIDAETYNLDPSLIGPSLNVSAILPTHVFGVPCDVVGMREAAARLDVPVIYDAAHCFGVGAQGQSVLRHGAVSMVSLHATKLFHSVEGGILYSPDEELMERFRLMRNFGHDGPGRFSAIGTNGKMSELHAAMGLANLDEIDTILNRRTEQFTAYSERLRAANVEMQAGHEPGSSNNCYFSILLESTETLLQLQATLAAAGYESRRYFWPLLSELDYVDGACHLPVAMSVSSRILVLPLHHGVTDAHIDEAAGLVIRAVGEHS